VVETGSTQTGRRMLHVAQSSVARAVQQLEAVAGTALFERAGRGMLPTPAGQQLALRAARALQLFADADRHRTRHATTRWHESPLALGLAARHVEVSLAVAAGASEARAAQQLGSASLRCTKACNSWPT